MVNSKRKGKVGELEASKAWAEAFRCEARRGQQFAGGADSPDIVHSVPGVHLEVKRTERLHLYDALEQAQSESGGSCPVVLHRANNRQWVAIVPLDALPELVTKLYLWLAGVR